MPELLRTIEASSLGSWVRETMWAFPALETLHFFGLCLLMGSLLIIELRLLGLAPRFPIAPIHEYLRFAALGFAINLTTGLLFFTADPLRYFPNTAFRVKMLLILLAGLNALWFKFTVFRDLQHGSPDAIAGQPAKLIAGVSLVLWLGVIFGGRLIPYVE